MRVYRLYLVRAPVPFIPVSALNVSCLSENSDGVRTALRRRGGVAWSAFNAMLVRPEGDSRRTPLRQEGVRTLQSLVGHW